jgi:hypothetical protein
MVTYQEFFNKHPAENHINRMFVEKVQEQFKETYHEEFENIANILFEIKFPLKEVEDIVIFIPAQLNLVNILSLFKRNIARFSRWREMETKTHALQNMEDLRLALITRDDMSLPEKRLFFSLYWKTISDFLSFRLDADKRG